MADESTYLEDERENYRWDETPAPLAPITIKGYGRKMAVETGPGSGEYTNEWGDVSSPEYVQDIDKTISSYDTGQITDAQLRERGGMPKRPSEADISRNDKWNEFWKNASKNMPDPVAEGRKAYQQYINNITSSYAYSDLALQKPETIMKWKQAADVIARQTAEKIKMDNYREKTIARAEFDKEMSLRERRIDAEKKAVELRNKKLVPNYDTGYMERMNAVTGEREATDLPVKPQADKVPNEASIISSLEKTLPPNADIGNAYAAYRQYLEDGYDSATALRHTIQYMKGNVQGGAEKQLDKNTAASILKEVGGDKNKARQIAKQRGYKF